MIELASPWGLVLLVLALIGVTTLAVIVVSGSRLRHAWRVVREPRVADAVEQMLRGATAPAPVPARAPGVTPARSEALSLLAILQQEARLVDFFKEPLDGYTDAQIGAAVRDVHRDGAAALERLFGIRPLRHEPEGSDVILPAGFDAGTVRLTGRVTGAAPYRGKLRHPGWTTTKLELPRWTGDADAARVIAPAEVELP